MNEVCVDAWAYLRKRQTMGANQLSAFGHVTTVNGVINSPRQGL